MKRTNVLVFDGVCNFCNWAVNFVIKRDIGNHFVFAPLQSKIAQSILHDLDLELDGEDTIILVIDEDVFVRSEAVLEIFRHLGGGWKYLRVLKIFPLKLRDWGYSFFAKYRYRLFGKRDVCMIPSDKIKEKFLD